VTDTLSSERLPLPSIIRSDRTGNKAAGSGVRELGQRPTRHTLMPRLYCRAALLSLLGLFAVAMSIAGARAEVPYSVEITGVDDDQLEQDLEAVSQLVKLKDRPPASEAMLRRRAEDDLPRLKQVVEAAGYRAATVDYAIDQSTDPAGALAARTYVTTGAVSDAPNALATGRWAAPKTSAAAAFAGQKPSRAPSFRASASNALSRPQRTMISSTTPP